MKRDWICAKVAFFAAGLSVTSAGLAETSNEQWVEGHFAELDAHFQLHQNCDAMAVFVGIQDNRRNASATGLTEHALMSAIESRLRGARLYVDDADFHPYFTPYLSLRVTALERAFAVQLKLFRRLCHGEEVAAARWEAHCAGTEDAYLRWRSCDGDPPSGPCMPAVTWETSWIGSFGSDGRVVEAGNIRNLVARDVDQFLVEYLRVNETACNARLGSGDASRDVRKE